MKEVPELLFDQIAGFSSIVQKQKALTPNSEAIAFYEFHLRVLQQCYAFMIDAERELTENTRLKHQIAFTGAEIKKLRFFEDSINNILSLQAQGKLDEIASIAANLSHPPSNL